MKTKKVLLEVEVPDWFEFDDDETSVELDRMTCDARLLPAGGGDVVTDIARLRQEIGCYPIDDDDKYSDNLSIALCSYFESHIQCPIDHEQTENGWNPWAEAKANAAVDGLSLAVHKLIAPQPPVEKREAVPDERDELLRNALEALENYEEQSRPLARARLVMSAIRKLLAAQAKGEGDE